MQQRFSKNEIKRFQISNVCNAGDLRLHQWLTSADAVDPESMKKKKS
jgi:hypothetical protein